MKRIGYAIATVILLLTEVLIALYNAIESIKQGYENSEIPQVIIDKLVQIANG